MHLLVWNVVAILWSQSCPTLGNLTALKVSFSKASDNPDCSSFCSSSILANGKTELINQVPSKGKTGVLILCIDYLDYRGWPCMLATWFGYNYYLIITTANFRIQTVYICLAVKRLICLNEMFVPCSNCRKFVEC